MLTKVFVQGRDTCRWYLCHAAAWHSFDKTAKALHQLVPQGPKWI